MAWTAPKTWAVSEVVTAAMLNTQLKDNLNDLDARATVLSDYVAAAQTRSSTSFGDLSTVGPSVTVSTGSNAVVMLLASMANDTAGNGCQMSIQVSGASTIAPSATYSIRTISSTAGRTYQVSAVFVVSGLTPGSNTFVAKYRVELGGTGTFSERRLAVFPANKLA